ncbi:signal recognition particle, SRP14 subunit [Pilobolus umbonatus]|nr:signal recognition particle, SRP14 subunit [Pilobolus umbonatus]
MRHLSLTFQQFTVELGQFYEKSKTTGMVSVTMKRMTADRLKRAAKVKKVMPKGGETVVENPTSTDIQYPIIYRATYKKSKISTIVSPDEMEKFQHAYATVIRAYMDTLKKKERAKKVKKVTK